MVIAGTPGIGSFIRPLDLDVVNLACAVHSDDIKACAAPIKIRSRALGDSFLIASMYFGWKPEARRLIRHHPFGRIFLLLFYQMERECQYEGSFVRCAVWE